MTFIVMVYCDFFMNPNVILAVIEYMPKDNINNRRICVRNH